MTAQSVRRAAQTAAHATITHVQQVNAPSAQAILHTHLIAGTSPLLHAFGALAAVLAGLGGSVCLLAILVGGLMHTQVFHTPDAPAQGSRIIRYALAGLGVMGSSVLLVKMTLAL